MSKQLRGRKKIKAPGRLLKLQKNLDKYLFQQSAKEHKTMTAFVEELLEFRKRFKQLPT